MGQWNRRLEIMEINSLEKIYKNKNVFVTGHTGFKGTWLLCLLHKLGANVKGYALAPENASDVYNRINASELCESVIADIKDADRLKKEILDFRPDFIFHLAAQPLVKLSYDIPLETFYVNSQGSAHVLDALRSLNKACVCVMITTDKVYKNEETGRFYSEDDRLGGNDPYSASKASAEIVIDSYRRSFFDPEKYSQHQKSVSVGRAGNVIGGGDWSKDRIIPDIVNALSSGRAVKVRNPASVRPWQHVLEPLTGYLQLAAKQVTEPVKFAAAFNFGPEKQDTIPVSKLVQIAIDSWGSGSQENITTENAPHEAGLLHLDISKAIENLNWKPKLNSLQAIELTMAWYKAERNQQKNIREFTMQQITNYLKPSYE